MSDDAMQAIDLALRQAMEIVRGAYNEAMRQHGLLPDTIKLIEIQAEHNLGELMDDEENPPPSTRPMTERSAVDETPLTP
ncbi:hypothetical protein ACQEU3_14925 [Spirillospora sp. CA-253888]